MFTLPPELHVPNDPPRYPLSEHTDYNRGQDEKSLNSVLQKIEEWKAKGKDVVAVIIEPLMAEGGDNQISAEFGRGLRRLTKEQVEDHYSSS